MANDPNTALMASQMVFSVCASSDIVAGATDAASATPGSMFAGEFHDYITAEKHPQFSAALRKTPGCVAVVDCDRNPELALETMKRLQAIFLNRLSIVAISSELDSELLLRSMRAGCNEFLTKPVNVEEMAASFARFQNNYVGDLLPHQQLGRVISFFGAKGGVGTSTLAVHLAMSLVRSHQKKTLLIDHHHELGHVGLYLGLKDSTYSFVDLIRNVDRLDSDLLKGFVVKHGSGLDVLASPDMCAPPHAGTSQEIEQVMHFLQRHYDYILVDSSLGYKESLTGLLHASAEICMISTPDVAALRDLSRRIEHLSLTDAMARKIRIIINRSTSNDAVSVEEVEKLVRFPVSIAIPNNYVELVRAINAGVPIPSGQRSGFSQQFSRWSSKLEVGILEPEVGKETKGLLNFLRKKPVNAVPRSAHG